MLLRARSAVTLQLLIVLITGAARADDWAAPSKKRYYSVDKKYCLEVIPKDLKESRPRAVFYDLVGTTYSRKAEFPLVNKVSPVNALVSRDGKHVVTFDNWYQVGYGDDVVVIYRSDGSLVKKFGLGELFTKSDIQHFRRSVSSIWWGGDHYIDDEKGILHLKTAREDETRELTIELATGREFEPAPPSFVPQRHVTPQVEFDAISTNTVEIVAAEAPTRTTPGEPVCNAPAAKLETATAIRISSQQLRAKARSLSLPGYPPMAAAKRIEGRVIVEVLVSKIGDVICARTLDGDPLLRAAVVQAAKRWKFEAFESTADAAEVVSTLAVNFKLR